MSAQGIDERMINVQYYHYYSQNTGYDRQEHTWGEWLKNIGFDWQENIGYDWQEHPWESG